MVHGLRGRRSNRRIADKIKGKATKILRDPDWHEFGPTFASEQLAKQHNIEAGAGARYRIVVSRDCASIVLDRWYELRHLFITGSSADRLHQSRRGDQEGTVQARNRGGRTATIPEIWRAALAAQAQLPKVERQKEPIQVLP